MISGARLLTWFNFNASMGISNYIHNNVWDEIDYIFPNFAPLKFRNG